MLQHKKEAIAKKERKEIAGLIERGKEETARIKTEGIIGEDVSENYPREASLCSEVSLQNKHPLPDRSTLSSSRFWSFTAKLFWLALPCWTCQGKLKSMS